MNEQAVQPDTRQERSKTTGVALGEVSELGAVSPRPMEADLVVCVHLHSHGLHLRYLACESAAHRFARNWTATHLPDFAAVENACTATDLGRLPDERLWIVP